MVARIWLSVPSPFYGVCVFFDKVRPPGFGLKVTSCDCKNNVEHSWNLVIHACVWHTVLSTQTQRIQCRNVCDGCCFFISLFPLQRQSPTWRYDPGWSRRWLRGGAAPCWREETEILWPLTRRGLWSWWVCHLGQVTLNCCYSACCTSCVLKPPRILFLCYLKCCHNLLFFKSHRDVC